MLISTKKTQSFGVVKIFNMYFLKSLMHLFDQKYSKKQ